jgi:hypothetical protein
LTFREVQSVPPLHFHHKEKVHQENAIPVLQGIKNQSRVLFSRMGKKIFLDPVSVSVPLDHFEVFQIRFDMHPDLLDGVIGVGLGSVEEEIGDLTLHHQIEIPADR